MAFAKSGFARFMASSAGRILRIVAGLVIIAVGVLLIQGVVGWIIAVIGLVPLAAGVFDFCIFGPVFSGPFWGRQLRQDQSQSSK